MIINEELLGLIKILNNEFLWMYVATVIAIFYGLIALFTWNLKKPLMFLGIPSIIVGIILMIIRPVANMIIPNKNILTVLNSLTKPILTNAIICIALGILMIVLYFILKKVEKNKREIITTEV